MPARPDRRRRGETLVDHLLVFTLVVIGGIVAAYAFMPDVQRAVGTLADGVAARFGVRPD